MASTELVLVSSNSDSCCRSGAHTPESDPVQGGDHRIALGVPRPGDGSREETLDDIAVQIRQAHINVVIASAAVVAFALTAGYLLRRAKSLVPVGSWEDWVEKNCQFSSRTAQDYMRVAHAFDAGLLDPQHAAGFMSLRKVLFMLREKRRTDKQDQGPAADDWSSYPSDIVDDLIAWDKACQRLLVLTKRLGDEKLAAYDLTIREQFRKLMIGTIVALWPHGRPQGRSERVPE